MSVGFATAPLLVAVTVVSVCRPPGDNLGDAQGSGGRPPRLTSDAQLVDGERSDPHIIGLKLANDRFSDNQPADRDRPDSQRAKSRLDRRTDR